MKPQLLPIRKLLGMHFCVAAYQRGYRWEEEQVLHLLDDIKKFNKNAFIVFSH
jgi:uncharacterized protein with ParB-like and HNH nuclease domain